MTASCPAMLSDQGLAENLTFQTPRLSSALKGSIVLYGGLSGKLRGRKTSKLRNAAIALEVEFSAVSAYPHRGKYDWIFLRETIRRDVCSPYAGAQAQTVFLTCVVPASCTMYLTE